jgi:hypothetical protein
MRVLAGAALAAIGSLCVSASLGAQARAGNTVLSRPSAESADGFTMVGGIRELSNGKVLVSDPMERSVQLVDLAAGTAIKVGREGQGPGEYAFPGDLLPLPGDTTLLVDRMNRRFLIILPNGKTGESIAYPGDLGLGVDPRFVDAAGRIYFQGSALPPGGRLEGSVTLPDSVPLFRWDRRSRMDTVAFLKLPSMTLNPSGNGASVGRVMIMRPQPFTPEDAWAVARDGRLAIARVADFHIDWFSPAKQKTSGPVNRFERLRVNEADKEAQRRAMRNPRVFVSAGPGGSRGASPPPPVDMPEPEYPEFKPPFPGRSAWIAPDGNLWLLRSRLGGDPVPTLDVFDGRGTLIGKVTIPKDRRIVGFGAHSVYMARTDSDDIQWLERYALSSR